MRIPTEGDMRFHRELTNMLRLRFLSLAIMVSLLVCPLGHAQAHTMVLPKGHGFLQGEVIFYLNNPPGNTSIIAQSLDFNQNPSAFGQFVGFVPGTSIQTDLDYTARAQVWLPTLAYGLTESITLVGIIPVFDEAKVQIDKFKVTGPTGDVTAQAQQKLADAGYKDPDGSAPTHPVNSWRGSGLGDIAAGARWRFWKSRALSSAVTVVGQFPTGKTEDPDILTDFGLGDGQVDLHTYFDFDWQPFPQATLTSSLGYQLQLPGKRDVRPLLRSKERAWFDLGDVLSAGTEAQYTILKWLPISAGYRYQKKFQDRYRGSQDLSSFEAGTSGNNHILSASVGISSLAPFLDKKFPYPFILSAGFRKTSSDNVNFKNKQLNVKLTLFF